MAPPPPPPSAAGARMRRGGNSGGRNLCLVGLSTIIVLLFSLCGAAICCSVVEYLPGYSGQLPFKLETGYVGVDDTDEVQLFYYFIESERDPSRDPLMLWLTGGPGCSGLSALLYEIGPLNFDTEAYTSGLPTLLLNKYSWTKVSSIIFVDAPVGVGFSYGTAKEAYNVSDTTAAKQLHAFLRKWLATHPEFLGNQLYVGGDAYSGITLPLLVAEILEGLEEGKRPIMEFQGYVLGNPHTDDFVDSNYRIPYAHRVSLLSDKLYDDAKFFCDGNFVNIENNNTLCVLTLETIKECLLRINPNQILEPQCVFSRQKPSQLRSDYGAKGAEDVRDSLSQYRISLLPILKCRSYSYMLSYKWANDAGVQAALHVRNGTVKRWSRCPKSIPYYTKNVNSTIGYHKNFTRTSLRALIYSGDQALSLSYMGTQAWIKSLGVPVSDVWRPWYIDGQVAGYTTKYSNDNYGLTYCTVKGAGLTAPEYKPKETLNMIDRFFAHYPI